MPQYALYTARQPRSQHIYGKSKLLAQISRYNNSKYRLGQQSLRITLACIWYTRVRASLGAYDLTRRQREPLWWSPGETVRVTSFSQVTRHRHTASYEVLRMGSLMHVGMPDLEKNYRLSTDTAADIFTSIGVRAGSRRPFDAASEQHSRLYSYCALSEPKPHYTIAGFVLCANETQTSARRNPGAVRMSQPCPVSCTVTHMLRAGCREYIISRDSYCGPTEDTLHYRVLNTIGATHLATWFRLTLWQMVPRRHACWLAMAVCGRQRAVA